MYISQPEEPFKPNIACKKIASGLLQCRRIETGGIYTDCLQIALHGMR
jgi:hypothetical protein